MRIARLAVHEFGPLRDLEVALDLPRAGGLVVVEGPNEAGKSTLLRFVRAMLFGGERGQSSFHGALVMEEAGELYRIEQRGARATLTLTALGSGRRLEAALLGRMVGNLEANVYRQVFAIGLEELQGLDKLSGEGVQERIFSAAVAGAGRSVHAVRQTIAAELQGLWRARSDSTIRTAARQLRDALRRVREAEAAAADWPRLRAEEEELARAIQEREGRSEALGAEVRRGELLLALHDRWSARRAALAGLAGTPAHRPIPDEEVQRLRTLRTEADLLRSGEGRLARELEQLEPVAAATVPDEDLLPLRERIRTVVSGVSIQRQRLEEDLPRSKGELEAAESLLLSTLAGLGADWSEERLAALAPASLAAPDLDRWVEEFAAWRERRIQLQTERKAGADERDTAQAALEARRAAGADPAWLRAAGEVRALGEEAGAQRSRLERLQELRHEAERRAALLAAVRSRLGPAWDEARLAGFGDHDAWRREGEAAAALAERVASEHRQALAAAEQAESHRQRCQDARDALERPARTFAEAEEDRGARREELAHLEELGGVLQELRQAQQDRQAAEAALLAAAAALRPARGWWPLVLAVGLPLVLAAWLGRGSPPAGAALVVLAGVLAALLWPRRSAVRTHSALEGGRATAREAQQRLEAVERRAKALAAAAGLESVDLGSVNAALSRTRVREGELEREAGACRVWEAATEALRQAEERTAAARTRVKVAAEAEEETRQGWRQWCEAHGVPPHHRPGELPVFLTEVERAQEIVRLLASARAEAERLRAASEAWRQRVGDLAAHLPGGAGVPAEEALDPLRRACQGAEELETAQQALRAAEGRLTEAEGRLTALEQAGGELREQWDGWCREAGLPPLPDPEVARNWLAQARTAAARAAAVQAPRAMVAALGSRGAAWAADAAALLRAAGREPPPEGGLALLGAIERLGTALGSVEAAVGERERARERRERLAQEMEKTRATLIAKEASISTLLASWEVPSEAALAQRLEQQAQRQEWERTVGDAEAELGRRAGQDAEAVARLLDQDAPLRWRDDIDRWGKEIQLLQAELNDRETGLRTRLGELRSRREALEASRDIPTGMLQVQQHKRVLAEALRRWLVCRLADGLIAETLKEYERSHVPEVIRAASERFARVTRGRYQAVHAQEGGALTVTTGGDAVLGAADLSRGTQEQLYLVVRLGLVDSFARQSASLPLVLDDVLANADPERQEGLIRALVDAAAEHQTIMLTCHPQVSAAIRRQAPEAQVVHLERMVFGGPAVRPAVVAIAGPEVAATTEGEPPAAEPLRAQALAVLGAHPEGLGGTPLCEALGISPGTLRTVLAPLLDAGTVLREGRTRALRYRLAGTGEG